MEGNSSNSSTTSPTKSCSRCSTSSSSRTQSTRRTTMRMRALSMATRKKSSSSRSTISTRWMRRMMMTRCDKRKQDYKQHFTDIFWEYWGSSFKYLQSRKSKIIFYSLKWRTLSPTLKHCLSISLACSRNPQEEHLKHQSLKIISIYKARTPLELMLRCNIIKNLCQVLQLFKEWQLNRESRILQQPHKPRYKPSCNASKTQLSWFPSQGIDIQWLRQISELNLLCRAGNISCLQFIRFIYSFYRDQYLDQNQWKTCDLFGPKAVLLWLHNSFQDISNMNEALEYCINLDLIINNNQYDERIIKGTQQPNLLQQVSSQYIQNGRIARAQTGKPRYDHQEAAKIHSNTTPTDDSESYSLMSSSNRGGATTRKNKHHYLTQNQPVSKQESIGKSKSKEKKKTSVSKKRRGTAAKQQTTELQQKRRVSSLTAVSQIFGLSQKAKKKSKERAAGAIGSRNQQLINSLSGNNPLPEQSAQPFNYQLSFSKQLGKPDLNPFQHEEKLAKFKSQTTIKERSKSTNERAKRQPTKLPSRDFQQEAPTNIVFQKQAQEYNQQEIEQQLSISSINNDQKYGQILDQLNDSSQDSDDAALDKQTKTIMQGRAIQMMVSSLKHYLKDHKRKFFEKWRFQVVAQRSNVQILAQTRWVNELQSMRTESELELRQKDRELTIRKCIASIFRFKSRKLASAFSQWKYKSQFIKYMESYINYKRSSYGADGTSPNQSYHQYNHDSRRSEFLPSSLLMSKNHLPIPQMRKITDRSSVERHRQPVSFDEELENIDESEELDERTLSKKKKIELMSNNQVGRSSKHQYNFTNPTADLEQLPYQVDVFRQILQSPTKDFGRLMKNSSGCSIQYMNDGGTPDESKNERRGSAIRYNAGNIVQKNQALLTVKKHLDGQLREVFMIWRRETDHYVLDLKYRVQQKEKFVSKKMASKLSSLLTISKSNHLRHMQSSFNNWKMLTFIDKRAENRRLQLYLLDNAKQEIQRSKDVLSRLYMQRYNTQEQTPAHLTFGSLGAASVESGRDPHVMSLMNPYFQRNQHALPERLQQMVNQKQSQQELMSHIKTLCYDMLLDIIDVAEKKNSRPSGATGASMSERRDDEEEDEEAQSGYTSSSGSRPAQFRQ